MNPTPQQVSARNARIAKINLQIRELQKKPISKLRDLESKYNQSNLGKCDICISYNLLVVVF